MMSRLILIFLLVDNSLQEKLDSGASIISINGGLEQRFMTF
jgi:hypothetical protein